MWQDEIEGIPVYCKTSQIEEILFSQDGVKYYPKIVTVNKSNEKLFSASPLHGRSIIVDYNPEFKRYIITKGNGLTYFPFGFISTEEFDSNAWGYLRKKDAVRDFKSGSYISELGVLTNEMEAVYTLKEESVRFSNCINKLNPTLLQYSVLCPYRIADIPFLSKALVTSFVKNWANTFNDENDDLHCIAANILLKNIKIMHENNVLHNAIHSQNYSLSLELLDFELSRTPLTPYDNDVDEQSFEKLQKREIIQSLEVVNQIAFYFKENINNQILRKIMIKYGYENYLNPI
jgi:hypothetical protein